MIFASLFGQQALGPAGSQGALNDRLEQAQRLWPEYPNAWGHQIDAWEFGYEFDPSTIGIPEPPRSLDEIQTLGNSGGNIEGVSEPPGVPLWQRAACTANRLVSQQAYEDCLTGFGRAGGLSQEEAYARGTAQAERDSFGRLLMRGAYIGVGFAMFVIGLAIIGFVKPKDLEAGVKSVIPGNRVAQGATE